MAYLGLLKRSASIVKNTFFIALLLSVCVMSLGCGRHVITLRVQTPDCKENGRNWFVARELLYDALTQTDPRQREVFFAETFRTLGYVLHLLEDMAVPAHTGDCPGRQTKGGFFRA